MLYFILATLLIVSLYNSVWIHDCALGCLAIRDGEHRAINRCTCNTCFCAPIQRYGTQAVRAADSISLLLSTYTDRFHNWIADSGTCVRRHAQLAIGDRPSFYIESIEDFTLVPDSEVCVADNIIPQRKAAICASTSMAETENVTQTASLIQSSNVAQVVTSATQYSYDLVGKFTELAHNLSRIEPNVLLTPTRLRSKLVSNSGTSTKSRVPEVEETIDEERDCPICVEDDKICIRLRPIADRKQSQLPEVKETIDPKKNCSKCVERGIVCVRGCPIADRKQRQLNIQ